MKILQYSTLLKAMGNPRRLEILFHLYKQENSVGELEKKINLSQSALSQHLAVLRKEKIVKTRRKAQTIYYSIQDKNAIKIIELLQKL